MSIKKQTVSGIKWLAGSSFLQKAISTVTTVVLARILEPSVFGLYSLAFVAIDALGLFKSMGFDSALIRRKDDVEKAANTAFFIIPVLGISLYLVLSLTAPFIGKFLNNQEVVGVIRALGIIFVISCFGKIPAALLEKSMRFKNITVIELSASTLYSVAAIIFAFLKFGVWSLVVAFILKTIFQNSMFFVVSRWRPNGTFDKRVALEMFHFGKFLFLGGVVWFLKMNLDNVLVGKLLGVTALGFYAIAFNIANFGADYFGSKVYRVAFPAYSKLQGDPDHLKRGVLKVFKHVALVAFPLCTILICLSKELLVFIYGQKWVDAAGVLRVLAFAGLFNTLPASMGALFLASGKPKLSFWITVMQVAIFLFFITPLAKLYDVKGVGIVVSAASFLGFCVTLGFTMKIISASLMQMCLVLKPAFMASMIMATGIILIKGAVLNLAPALPLPYHFIVMVTLPIGLFVLSLSIIEKNFIRDIKETLFR